MRESLRRTLAADLGWHGVATLPELLTVRAISTVLFRVSQACGRRSPTVAYLLKQLNHVLTGADLAWQATVGPGLRLYHPTGVVIGPDVVIGSDCQVQQGVTLGAARERGRRPDGVLDSPVVGDRVRVGSGAKVLGPIGLGDDVVVGANAVVVRSAEAKSLCVGIPAVARPRTE